MIAVLMMVVLAISANSDVSPSATSVPPMVHPEWIQDGKEQDTGPR